MTISRRELLGLAATGAALAAAPGAPRIAAAQPAVKIGTAVLADYLLAAPVVVAVEKGFFKEQGVSAEFLPFRGGPDLVKAVIAGDVLVGLTGSTDIVQFREAGMPIKMVATHGEANTFVLLGAPGGPGADDLKGKGIGITRPGSATWVFARMVARHRGWDPDRDVQIVPLGGLDAQLAALARKEIAAFVWGDYGGVSAAQGRTTVIFRFDSITPKWISAIQYSSEDQIKTRGDQIRRSLRALFQAFRAMKADPQETARIVAPRLGWSPDVVMVVHRASVPIFPADGRIDPGALRAMQDTLLEAGAIKKRLPIEEHYTTEFTPVRL